MDDITSDAGPAPPEIAWLSFEEARARLGITPRTLCRYIEEGLLPAYRFGRVIRLHQAEVDEFIIRSRIAPANNNDARWSVRDTESQPER